MTATIEPAVTLDIEVAAAALALADRPAVQEVLQRCATQLVADLALGIEPRVSVTPFAVEAAPGRGPGKRIGIGGMAGRVRWWLPGDRDGSPGPDPITLAGDLCDDLVANRALFVTAECARALQRTQSGMLAELPEADFAGLLREAVALGVRASRLEGVATPEVGTLLDLSTVVDRGHEAALSCSIEVSEADHFEHLFEATPWEWREVLGLPVPAETTFVGGMARNDFRVRVNDLSLPVTNVSKWSRMFGRVKAPGVAPIVAAVQRQLEEVSPLFASAGAIHLLRDMLGRTHPRLVEEARRIRAADYCRAARHLLAERVPLTDLRGITEALLTTYGRGGINDVEQIVFDPPSGVMLPVAGPVTTPLSPGELADVARISQDRLLLARVGPPQGALAVTVLANSVEAAIVGADGEKLAALAPRVLAAVAAAFVESKGPDPHPRVVLCSGAARRLVHEMLRMEFPDACVVSYGELPPDVDLEVASRAILD